MKILGWALIVMGAINGVRVLSIELSDPTRENPVNAALGDVDFLPNPFPRWPGLAVDAGVAGLGAYLVSR
jgi:hypothetical protein